jgi:transposase
MWDRQSGHSAHFVLDLERTAGGIRIACVRHRYHAIECACGVRTPTHPGVGVLSTVPGRSRDLLLSEACLVGPALATFIAALSVRTHVSRAKIREFLAVRFGVPLSVGTLDRCIREVGVACEPAVEDLLGDLRQGGVIHADETPWRQHGRLRWLWVVLSSTTAIFHIGSRQGDEIRDLIADAFLGWLVSDGYGVYRKFKKRQRCLAHLIRKGIALAGGLDPVGVNFGDWLLREMRGLIHEVAEGTGARIINPILARLKRACKLHRDDSAKKVRALAREVLNDWAAITAFVTNPELPATNNEAERALRDAVIARRISNGTRTEEGSAAYAATLSVFETCRRRGVEPWHYITDLLARARKGLPHFIIPLSA